MEGNGVEPLPEGSPRLCVEGRRAAGTCAVNPVSTRPEAGAVCSAVGTEEGVSMAKKGFPQRVRDLALELTWKNYSSINICATRRIHRAQKGVECLPDTRKRIRKGRGWEVNDKSY